jgi:hypothetical protein
LVLTILPAYLASAATFDVKNVSSNKRVCTKVSDDGNVCKTSAQLKCTFTDINGVLRSCLAEDNATPFFHVNSSQCGVVEATIEMKVCNLNTAPDHWIQPWTTSNNFLFETNEIVPNPDRFKRLNPGQCRILKTVKPLNTCVKTHPMSVALEGNMPDLQGGSHCRCYLWRQSRVEIYDDTAPVPSSLVKTCSSADSSSTFPNSCDAEVSISCEYTQGGQTKSCMSNGIEQPFVQFAEDQCQNIEATIKLEMCNKDQSLFLPWKPSDGKEGVDRFSFFRYVGSFYDTPIANISPGNCVSWTSTQNLDTCARQSWPMNVKFEGNLSNDDYCYCYLFHRTYAALLPEPPVAELDTTLIITEMLDGTDGNNFVELYAPDARLRDSVITDDLYLCQMNAQGPVWNTAIPLFNTKVNSNGFIVLCNDSAVYSGCKVVSEIVTNNFFGCMDVAIVRGGSLEYEIVDSYGIVGSSCDTGDVSRFTGGRTARLPSFVSPTNPWIKSHWTISTPLGVAGASPGVWDSGTVPSSTIPIIITEAVDLSTGDPSAPKFIELYVTDQTKHGTVFPDNLNLVRIPSGGSSPDFSSMIPLKGFFIRSDGFIVLCNVEADNIWSPRCDETYDTSEDKLVTSDTLGCDDIAIVSGSTQDSYTIVDIYGNPGEQCNVGNQSSFTNGKAERINSTQSKQPKKVWVKSDWVIKSEANVEDCHPRDWSVPTQIMITELTDPSGEPENRYIELYSPNKKSYEILENYWVVLKGTPDYSYPLKGKRIGSDGYLLLCRSRTFWTELQCDHQLGPNSVADNNGCQVVIIYSDGDGTNFDPNDIVDVYGIGNACAGNFQGGVVERIESLNRPNPVFTSQEWVVSRPAAKGQCTPRARRISSGGGVTPTAPSPSPPALAPTKMPSNKKNKNNKNTSPSTSGIYDPSGSSPASSPSSGGKGAKSSKSSKSGTETTVESSSSLLTSQSKLADENSAASVNVLFGTLIAGVAGWLCLW